MRVWDARQAREAHNVAPHASDGGSGAVGTIRTGDVGGGGGGLLVTAGADRRLCVLDPRKASTLLYSRCEETRSSCGTSYD